MIEMKPVDESGRTIPSNATKSADQDLSFLKKRKLYLIIGISVLLIIILVVVLCVTLTGNSDKGKKPIDDKSDTIPEEPLEIKNNVKLEVYSDNDEKEISFLSEEYDVNEQGLRNLKENSIMYIDGKNYSFKKSMKLQKGNHTIDIIFEEKINHCQNMFKNCRDIKNIYINVSNECDNMDYMFSGCSSLVSVNTENINTSEVTSMNNLFSGCSSLEDLNLDNFDTGKVTNMEEMFKDWYSITNFNLNAFNTGSVLNMQGMFSGCKSAKNFDLGSFDTSLVTNMEKMFSECNSIHSIYLSNFNTTSVNNMNEMFSGCTALTNIDIN